MNRKTIQNCSINKQVQIKSIGNDIYFEKKSIILDKICPRCRQYIWEEKDYCTCGFSLKSSKDKAIWITIISTILALVTLVLILIINIETINKYTFKKIEGRNAGLNSLSPVNIQVITSLKNSSFSDYIQNVYVKPDKKNELMILIKPTLWNILTPEEKKELLKEVKENWIIIYKRNYPESKTEPGVSFANLE